MEQLLKISTVPIKIDFKIHRAKLEYNNQLPKVDITRENGEYKIRAKPIKIQIDNQPMRDTINLKTPMTVGKDYGEESMQLSYNAIANYVKEGNMLLDAKDISPAQIAAQQNTRNIESIVSFLPDAGPEISWKDGTLNIHYTADDLNFDWDTVQKAGFEFIPGSIEFLVKERPRVDIEYVGKPIYCPPSADPNYIEPELDKLV